jgi:hypothetical protein
VPTLLGDLLFVSNLGGIMSSSIPASAAASAPVSAPISVPVGEVAAKPFFDQAIWSAVPSIFWVCAVLTIIFYFRKEIRMLVQAMVSRLKDGASIKVAGLEIGTSSGLLATPGDFSKEDSRVGVYQDDKSREILRENIYKDARGVMLVHRIQRSIKEGQLYDILIYVVPHRSSLAGVMTVEYFFGSYWHNKIYPSHDRSRGFPIVTSAYGSFLCTAKVNFNDGTHTFLSRYIDFEMGGVAALASKTN